MRDDWETPPTVDGIIVYAEIGKDDGENKWPDILHVKGVDVAEETPDLIRVPADPGRQKKESAEGDRPFFMVGKHGTLEIHGYTEAKDLIGKQCLIYSDGKFNMLSIAPDFGIVIWQALV
jgi:hypothetical protein